MNHDPRDWIVPLAQLLAWSVLILIGIWAISVGVRWGMSSPPPRRSRSTNIPTAFVAGPGHYRIEGVRRDTREDVSVLIDADSGANARAKAELEGIVVTSVEFEA